jgi:hypothetical protein
MHCSRRVRGNNNPRGTKDWGWKLALSKKHAVPKKIKATQNDRNRSKVQYKSTLGISVIF